MFNLFKTKTQETPIQETNIQLSFKDIRQNWKQLAKDKKITKEDVAALCLYRALLKTSTPDDTARAIIIGNGKEAALSRLKKSFKEVTNTIKLANGAAPYGAAESALRMVKYSTVLTWLGENEQKIMIELGRALANEGIK